MKKEFLPLAHTYKNQDLTSWFMSEKLDGHRCFWDGGITRGKEKSQIPWANTEKDSRYKVVPKCTGLWSRLRHPIQAPDYFLDALPRLPLDGELYNPVLSRQDISSIVKKLEPSDFDWRMNGIKLHVFDTPPASSMDLSIESVSESWVFADRLKYLQDMEIPESMVLVDQIQLSRSWKQEVSSFLDTVLDRGGEGLMYRHPQSYFVRARTHELLKHKPFDEMEGTIIGYTSGRETDKGSRLLGKMGALIVVTDTDHILELSGFTDQMREFQSDKERDYAIANPGKRMPDWFVNSNLPVGTKVIFKYRGTSNMGVPQEARFWSVL